MFYADFDLCGKVSKNVIGNAKIVLQKLIKGNLELLFQLITNFQLSLKFV
jgi:hypothetical protein